MKNNAKFRFTLAFANIFIFVSVCFWFVFVFVLFHFDFLFPACFQCKGKSVQHNIFPSIVGRQYACQAARFVPAGQGASSASPSGGVTVPTTVSGMATSTAPKVIIVIIIIIIIIIVLIIITRYSHGLN